MEINVDGECTKWLKQTKPFDTKSINKITHNKNTALYTLNLLRTMKNKTHKGKQIQDYLRLTDSVILLILDVSSV